MTRLDYIQQLISAWMDFNWEKSRAEIQFSGRVVKSLAEYLHDHSDLCAPAAKPKYDLAEFTKAALVGTSTASHGNYVALVKRATEIASIAIKELEEIDALMADPQYPHSNMIDVIRTKK